MPLNEIDISELNYPELNELKAMIEGRMEELREQGVPALRERFAEEAATLGVTLEEVVGSTRKKAGSAAKAAAGAGCWATRRCFLKATTQRRAGEIPRVPRWHFTVCNGLVTSHSLLPSHTAQECQQETWLDGLRA